MQAVQTAEMEREYKERRITAPQLDAEHVRYYEIGGDHVPWAPVKVVGDDQHTVIHLPPTDGRRPANAHRY